MHSQWKRSPSQRSGIRDIVNHLYTENGGQSLSVNNVMPSIRGKSIHTTWVFIMQCLRGLPAKCLCRRLSYFRSSLRFRLCSWMLHNKHSVRRSLCEARIVYILWNGYTRLEGGAQEKTLHPQNCGCFDLCKDVDDSSPAH